MIGVSICGLMPAGRSDVVGNEIRSDRCLSQKWSSKVDIDRRSHHGGAVHSHSIPATYEADTYRGDEIPLHEFHTGAEELGLFHRERSHICDCLRSETLGRWRFVRLCRQSKHRSVSIRATLMYEFKLMGQRYILTGRRSLMTL